MDVAVVGLGLIGGSALRALARLGHRVRGYDADPATRTSARAAGGPTGWQVAETLPDAIRGVDLVVLAVPLPAMAGVLDEVTAAGYRGLITDVASVKAPVRELIRRHRGSPAGTAGDQPGGTAGDQPAGTAGDQPAGFVGGHPMAGRETAGFAASDPDLFTGCAWVLCLEPADTSLDDWLRLADLVTRLGARAVPATAEEHDRAVAAVSHVPHLLAAALAAVAAENLLATTLAAGSFRDGTRVAASPPSLVAAMCGGNAPAVAPALDRVRAALEAARAALDADDPITALRPWLEPGWAARSAWPPRGGREATLPADVDSLLALGRAGGWVTSVSADRRTVIAVPPTADPPTADPPTAVPPNGVPPTGREPTRREPAG